MQLYTAPIELSTFVAFYPSCNNKVQGDEYYSYNSSFSQQNLVDPNSNSSLTFPHKIELYHMSKTRGISPQYLSKIPFEKMWLFLSIIQS